jgi:3-deoxy-D-arabino-heptulosonate 7-phosphate (DAHP) synthase
MAQMAGLMVLIGNAVACLGTMLASCLKKRLKQKDIQSLTQLVCMVYEVVGADGKEPSIHREVSSAELVPTGLSGQFNRTKRSGKQNKNTKYD